MTKNMIFFVTIVTFDVCSIHTKTIIVEFFIFLLTFKLFIAVQILINALTFLKQFSFFFSNKKWNDYSFFYHFDYCFFLTNFKIYSIRFSNKIWFFYQIFVVFWRSTFNRVRLKKLCIAWNKLKCRWIFVKIFDRFFSNEMSIMINLFIDSSIFCFNFLIESTTFIIRK